MSELSERLPKASATPQHARLSLDALALSLFGVITALFFAQFWLEVGLTVRSEDLLIIMMAGLSLLIVLIQGRLRYRTSSISAPTLAWAAVLTLGIGITVLMATTGSVRQDAIVNGVRLLLTILLFQMVLSLRASFQSKAAMLIKAVLAMSLLTTLVSLIQIGHSDGFLPFTPPTVLIELKELPYEISQGREIFGLFIGNTVAHAWAHMIALQALLVWYLRGTVTSSFWRIVCIANFLLLGYILVRTAVRASTIGFFGALIGVSFLTSANRDLVNRLARWLGVLVAGVLVTSVVLLAFPDNYYVERIRLALPQVTERGLEFSRASNLYGRFDYYLVALELFASSPIVGVGFWQFGPQASAILGRVVSHAHNSYFQALAELGIIGVVVLIWWFVAVFRAIWARRQMLQGTNHARVIWQFSFAAMIFLVLASLVANPVWDPNAMGFRMGLLAVLMSYSNE